MLGGDYEASDSSFTLDFKAMDISEARDLEAS
jgi:hypothetical protein